MKLKRKPLPPGVERNTNRHGRVRFYFRPDRDQPRVRILSNDPTSAEFKAAYQACVAGLPQAASTGDATIAPRTPSNSLGWLIKLYLDSVEFKAYKPMTKDTRRRRLEKLGRDKGSVPLSKINRMVIQAAINDRRATPDEANTFLTTLSNMFAWATKELLTDPTTGSVAPILEENPAKFVDRIKKPKKTIADDEDDDGHPTMSDEHMATFEAAYAHGSYERLIYEVLLCTGLRVGDAARLNRFHVKGSEIRLNTEKTNTGVALRVLPRLTHALAVGPKGEDGVTTLLTSKRGQPWAKAYLGSTFAEACAKIGLPHSAHSMRKTAARRYIEAGALPGQLKAIFGWETMAMVDKYTKMFNRRKVSLAAMDDFVLDKAFANG